MCLGIPGQVVAVGDEIPHIARVDVWGGKREGTIARVCEGSPDELLGQGGLVHVGFAMSILDVAEAKDTLDGLMAMQEVDEDVGYFLRNGEPAPQVSE